MSAQPRESIVKASAISALRQSTRYYLRHAPWSAGKMRVAGIYHHYVGWRPHRQIVRTCFGARMDLTTPDAVSETIYTTGQWEPCLTEYIQRNLRPGDTFIDVGANVGYYALLASDIVGRSGRVFAIEASPKIFAQLRRNLDLNSCTNVRALNAAASDAKGTLSVYLAHAENLGHTTTVASLAAKEGMKVEAKVPADTLESLVGRDALFGARFVKVDVEGAELTVLSHLFESLHKFSDRTEWLLEFSPEYSAGGQSDVDSIYREFRAAGYRAYRIPNEYSWEFQFTPPRCSLTELTETPTSLCDVVMSRRKLT